MGYKEDLKIDRYNLDTEWETHANKFVEWAEKEVEAQFEKDKAKERLAITKSDIDMELREYAEKKSIKLTEAAILNSITGDPRYTKASSEYLIAVRNSNMLGVARDAFEHKKKALERMTDLWISGYWSDPKVSSTKSIVERRDQNDHRDKLKENPRLRRRAD